ncbi:DUF3489 domain-containing protein [Tritonibacter scottomollicae]|uniref:DUF3489 domain-containing protein n=1 Tax=Tritonibacter scottomollicae TaxID=483013 RepID=UPI003AA9AA11
MTKQTTTKSAGSSKKSTKETAAKPRETKIGKVIALLKRKDGATLDEMVEATGWLPHTTRAALTGLKKKGHTIECDKRGDANCYRITGSA